MVALHSLPWGRGGSDSGIVDILDDAVMQNFTHSRASSEFGVAR